MKPHGMPPEAIDCHVHAGLERAQGLEAILRYCADDGRRVVCLLDHAELYFEDPPDWAVIGLAYASRRIARDESLADMVDLYRKRLKGPEVFYRHAREGIAHHGSGIRTAIGIEISGASLEGKLVPPGWLDGADFIGICATQPPVESGKRRPWGEHLAKLVSLADALRGGRRMSLVLHHPFRWRLYEIASETAESTTAMPEAAGFTDEDARVTARALADAGALAEVNFATFFAGYIQERLGSPDRRQDVTAAARGAFVRLRDAGAKFSIGSDMHAVPDRLGIYRPSELITALGLTVEDVELPIGTEKA